MAQSKACNEQYSMTFTSVTIFQYFLTHFASQIYSLASKNQQMEGQVYESFIQRTALWI